MPLEPHSAPLNVPKLRVLVVDDQWIARAAIRAALEQLDEPFSVIDAETGEEALSIMRNVSVSVIFCDVHLPGISGPEALAHAYADRGEKPFMVLMSAQRSSSLREIGQRIGVYEFMPKPFKPQHVLAAMAAYRQIRKPTSVLLVDDSSVARRLMSRILARSQFQLALTEAGSGLEAVQAMRDHPFDVVFLDLNMPALSGVETATILLQSNPAAQIVIVSTEQQTAMVRSAQFAGAFAFLRKPFDEKDVDAVLHSAFDIRRPSLARGTHAIFADTSEADIVAGNTLTRPPEFRPAEVNQMLRPRRLPRGSLP
jgi:CheY-like chemotaxis protein